MPRPKLTQLAEEDLQAADRNFFTVIVSAIYELADNPDLGEDIPALQYSLDPFIPYPSKVYIKRTGTPYRIYIYHRVIDKTLWIEQIKVAPTM
jgi:hypothetical protein